MCKEVLMMKLRRVMTIRGLIFHSEENATIGL